MKYELPEIHVAEDIRKKALIPIQKMLDISARK
jgi:quinolinate synthase